MAKNLFAVLMVLALASLVSAKSEKIERGKYLAEEIGKCQDCHTPRLPSGEFDTSRWMRGSTLNIQPITEIPKWHKEAPSITPSGKIWERFKKEGMINYLITG